MIIERSTDVGWTLGEWFALPPIFAVSAPWPVWACHPLRKGFPANDGSLLGDLRGAASRSARRFTREANQLQSRSCTYIKINPDEMFLQTRAHRTA